MGDQKKATLEELDEKSRLGLFKIAEAIEDDMQLIEILRYLESTWNYLYVNLITVAVQLHAMNFRTKEQIIDVLQNMRTTIKERGMPDGEVGRSHDKT